MIARRPVDGKRDEGFALMFVLFVTTMMMIGTAAMLSVASGNVQPARASQDGYAALAAAQSGVQDYLAQLDANCRQISSQNCAWPTTHTPFTGTIGSQSYTVRALNPAAYLGANGGALRVVSTGSANGTTKTLTADLSGKPSVLRFTYFSNYETVGTSFLRSYYGPRTIPITDSTIATAVGLPVGSTVTWRGTGSAPSNGYTDTICDSYYYDDTSNPISGQGRSSLLRTRTALDPGTGFSEDGYTQSATAGVVLPTAAKVAVSRDASCQAWFGYGMTFAGPVYSRDAMSITNGQVGQATGPAFNVPAADPLPPASTGWTTTSTPAATAASPYLTDSQLGGTPTTTKTGAQAVVSAVQALTLPSAANPTADCVYSGPTRIVLSGSTATINSPNTTPIPNNKCYQSNGVGAGVVDAAVPIATTTIKVQNTTLTDDGSTPSLRGLSLGSGGDITRYSPVLGDAYVQGSLTSGRLSLVAADDIVVTGDVTTNTGYGANAYGEQNWTSGAAIDLIANRNVRVYHPVACASGTASGGWCPNDITGLYSGKSGADTPIKVVAASDGTLKSTHPSKQYTNISITRPTRIDAAVIALGGSFYTDNFNRGSALGSLTVDGGIYMNHRGPLGQLWEAPSSLAISARPSSGYKLQLNYVDYSKAGLPFVPVLDYGATAAGPWYILNLSTGGTP